MSAKAGFPSALVLMLLGLCTAQAGNPVTRLGDAVGTVDGQNNPVLDAPVTLEEMLPQPKVVAPVPSGTAVPIAENTSTFQLSSWIQNYRPDCCGPVGGDGPVMTELYVRGGPSLVVGGGVFNQLLNNGWEIQGGGRSLFFDSDKSTAWTIDLNLSDIHNQGQRNNEVVMVVSPRPTAAQMQAGTLLPARRIVAHLNDLNRTNFNVVLGREWELWFPQNSWNIQGRFGFDVGGHIGTMLAHFFMEKHRTDVLYGTVYSLHTDWEIPRGCWTFLAGVRVEYDHDWNHILQTQNNSHITDLNVLLNLGVRF